MSISHPSNGAAFRTARSRGLSTISSVIVIVVVLAMVGTVAYGIMGGFSPASSPSCQPANSPLCGRFANLHDVGVIVPFQSAQQGASVPFTVSLPGGESSSQFVYNWGDGTPAAKASSPTESHAYATPGVYLVLVQATVNGLVHDNAAQLVQLKITPSFNGLTNANVPGVSGAVLGNSSASPGGAAPTAVLQPGGTVTLGASYTSSPSNPLWREVPPTFTPVPTGGAVVSHSNSSANASETLRFDSPGTYQISFVGGSTSLTGSGSGSSAPQEFENFSWTIFVAAVGVHGGVVGLAVPQSPHPGTIIDYELAPGGARTEDPAIAYDTVSYEPIANVYQTLIAYNGTQVGPTWQSYIPVLATCVPGSPSCGSMYNGNTLINGTDYTFVISSAPQYYDSLTGGHWGVYPTDVMFSIARTLGFSTLPCVSCNNGWILAQALLDSGNATWDTIHQAFNNTPQNVLGAMTINSTSNNECPEIAITQEHGCITFHADGNHHDWPYFLELIADPLGGSIVPCGWYSANSQAAGIPYWTAGNSSGSGDHPCQAPGSSGYGVDPSTVPFEGWDQWETIGSGETGRFYGNVQYNMAGTGPYYLYAYSVGLSYTLRANPYYSQNPDCTWATCYPASHHYANSVQVTWETDPTQGEQALASGVADFATIPSSDIQLMLQLISQGKLNALTNPTISIGFVAFDLTFSESGAQRSTTNPVNAPGDWFSYLGMRQFIARAYPYQTIQSTINTVDGIELGFDYGGAIPQYMGNYYPTNISWPSTDPCTDASNASCPAFWWTQMHNPQSPYYDPEVASCSASSPCQLPLFGTTGNPVGDEVNALWEREIGSLSGGSIQVTTQDVNFVNLLINGQDSQPGGNPMPFYGLGWAPDYPDPTDYTTPLYLENSTYTYGDAVAQTLYVPGFGQSSCQPATNYSYYANLAQPVGDNCQGTAYKAMIKLLDIAAQTPAGPLRVLQYDMAEKIANQLALYVYTSQGNGLGTAAAWIDINSLNTNVTLGAGGATPFYWIQGNGLVPSG